MDELPEPPERRQSTLLAALREHRFYGAAVGYLVAAWIVLQVAAIVLPGFGAPAWVLRALMIVLAIGLGMTLLAVWGKDRRTRGLPLWPRTPHIRLAWVLTAILPALLVTAFSLLHPLNHPASAPTAAANPMDKTVAVLPFDNFSEDKDSAFFADGVQDEVLTDLSHVADLKVISRSSVMQYKKADARNLREIGKALGVAYVVEGSVQRAGNRIKVNAQLIDTRTDAHKWAEQYVRDLKDVFAIQSEIAQAIAGQLQAVISPREHAVMTDQPTVDLEAYRLYTEAADIFVWDDWQNADQSLSHKVELLERAVQRDPRFALAYCALAKTQCDFEEAAGNESANDHAHLALAKQAAATALRIRPDLGASHRAMAVCALHEGKYDQAHEEIVLALRTLPNDAEAHRIAGLIDEIQNRWDEGLAKLQKAFRLDPANEEVGYYLNRAYRLLRRYRESEALLRRRVPRNEQESYWITLGLAEDKLYGGDPAAAQALLDRIPLDFTPTDEIIAIRYLTALFGRDAAVVGRVMATTPANFVEDVYDGKPPESWTDGALARWRGDESAAHTAFAARRRRLDAEASEGEQGADHWASAALCDAGLGQKEQAVREARQAAALVPIAKDATASPVYTKTLALVFAWNGDKDQAIEQLGLSARLPAGITYGELRCSPYWDALRGDPRYEAIMTSLAPKP